MPAHRIYLTPPIGLPNLLCCNCHELIVAAAKVVYDSGDPDWFVYQHANGAESCPSSTVAEPFDDTDAYDALEPLYAAQLTEEGGTAAKSAQSARVQDAVDRLFNAERSRREFVAAGDRVSASAAATALRGVIEDLPLHDVRSLALSLFLRAAKAEA
jgi:hypothetical protein